MLAHPLTHSTVHLLYNSMWWNRCSHLAAHCRACKWVVLVQSTLTITIRSREVELDHPFAQLALLDYRYHYHLCQNTKTNSRWGLCFTIHLILLLYTLKLCKIWCKCFSAEKLFLLFLTLLTHSTKDSAEANFTVTQADDQMYTMEVSYHAISLCV